MPIPQTFDDAFTRVQELVAVFKQNESFYLAPLTTKPTRAKTSSTNSGSRSAGTLIMKSNWTLTSRK